MMDTASMASECDKVVEFFEERAAIREYCGGQPRYEAEHGAYWDCRKMFGREKIPQSITNLYLARSKQRQHDTKGF